MTEPIETPVEAPESHADGLSPEGDADTPGGNREARYRVQRNEARDQLAAANERIARLQRAEVERLAGASLSHAEDLFSLSGNDVADYLTEAGDVDPAKVAADIEAILSERPGLRRPAPAVDRSQSLGVPAETKTIGWDDLLR